ncbi:MAG: hypothetical protein WCR30_04735 [Clostridia bacterium]
MNNFVGSIEDSVQSAWKKPELIQALEIDNYEDNTFLSKLLKEDSSLYTLLLPRQMSLDAYMALLENAVEDYRKIPKSHRTDEIKLKALSIDEGIVYLFDDDELSYECVKYLFINAPFVLEDLSREKQKAIKPHLARIKKEKIVSTYNEDEPISDIDSDDLPDYNDDEE